MYQILNKNNYKKYLCLVILLFGLFFNGNLIISNIVSADSGFDSSWDSGSSSSSDFGGYDSSDYSSGDSEGSVGIFLWILYSVGICFGYAFVCSKFFKKDGKTSYPIWFTVTYLLFYLFSINYLFGEVGLCFSYSISSIVFFIYICSKLFSDGNYFVPPNWFVILYWILFLCSVYFIFDRFYFYVTITFFIIILLFVIPEMIRSKKQEKNSIKSMSEEQIYKQLGNDFNINQFNLKVFDMYRDIQIAWMERDVEPVRHLLSDEMFNMYRTQLATLIAKNQKNMMEDINFVDCSIKNISNKKGKQEIKVLLRVTCRDYLVDANNKTVRGNKGAINDYLYQLTFVRSSVPSKLKYCPNCGAKLENSVSDKCDYCGSVVVRDSDNFVMTDKKMITQSVKEYRKYEG